MLLSLLCLLSMLLGLAFSMSLDQRDVQTSDGISTNLSLANGEALKIDPRFGITYRGGRYPINGLSAYMNVLRSLAIQALLDWQSDLAQPSRVSQSPWNNVNVTASPLQEGQPVPRRYVVWGLAESIYYLAQHKFRSGTFYLKYDGQDVGVVVYNPSVIPPGDNLSESIKWTDSQALDGANARITVDTSYVDKGKTISIPGTYLPFSAALMFLAAFHQYDEVTTFDADNEEFDSTISLQNYGGSAGAPFATASNFISALWEVAKFVTSNRKFAELDAEFNINGRLVGRISLRVRAPKAGTSIGTGATS